MDSLKFVCSWQGTVRGARLSIKIGGLQLEGCTFDGTRLAENQRDSATVSSVPNCVVAWISKVRLCRTMLQNIYQTLSDVACR